MLEKTKLYYLYLKNKLTVKKPWDTLIIFVLNILVAIPIFIIIHQNLVQFNWYFHLDRILIFIVILVLIQFVLQAMRRITLISVFYISLHWYTELFLVVMGFKPFLKIINRCCTPWPKIRIHKILL